MKSKRIIIIITIILLNIALDQVTKFIAKEYIQGKGPIEVVGTVFILKYAENEGAFLSMGSELNPVVKLIFLSIIPFIILLLLLMYTVLKKNLPDVYAIGLSCIIGGGISNIYDRFAYSSSVIDFMNFGIGNLRTGILNFADLSIFAGALILIISSFKLNKSDKKGS